MIQKSKSLVKAVKNAPRSKKVALGVGVALLAAGVASVVLNKKVGEIVEAAVSETP